MNCLRFILGVLLTTFISCSNNKAILESQEAQIQKNDSIIDAQEKQIKEARDAFEMKMQEVFDEYEREKNSMQ